MRNTIILFALATCSLLLNKLQAQSQNQNVNPPIEELDNYDTFSAIYDEVGFKADVYREYGVPATATHTRIRFVETWTATEAWKALTDKEQVAYLQTLDDPDRFMLVNGVEIIKKGDNTEEDQLANVDFFTIWSAPDGESENGFEQLITNYDWYTYFRQVNIRNVDSINQEVIGYFFRH